MINGLFEAIDKKNINSFCNFLTPDCTFRFGNGEAVSGRENIKQYVAGFLNSIAALSHRTEELWEVADGTVCHGTVTYTRLNGSTHSVPFSKILKHDGEAIGEYMIFADISKLYSE